MNRRKGQMTRSAINRQWPWHVILPWEDRTLAERGEILARALALETAYKSRQVLHSDQIYLVVCFSDCQNALSFREMHDGEMIDPAEISNTNQWLPAENGMCNLYRVTSNQEAIRDITKAMIDSIGNLEPSLEVYPDKLGPVVRNTPTGRELAMLHWGMPSPTGIASVKPDTGITNIRNVASSHWRRWLGPHHRCLVPWTEFCEWEDTKPRKTKRWFALDDSKPPAFFAGIWTEWKGTRGSIKNPRVGAHQLFGFLTCPPNGIVAPIHPKAMPVILTTADEIELWLTAPWEEAKYLQRPLPDDGMILLPVESAQTQGELI